MKLHHRMLRHFIAASVIVLTSSFLIFELVASDRAMSAYLRYIVQRADSSFLYDKYQNQSIAAHVMRALAAEQSEVPPEQRRAICEAFESANNTHGLNLTAHKYRAYAAHYKPHPLTATQLWKLQHYYPLLIRQWKATATRMITVQVLGWPKRNFTIISISMTAMSIFMSRLMLNTLR